MQIIEVNEQRATQAGYIHSESWKASHRSFCTEAFVERHDVSAQTAYLRREMEAGKRVFMLVDQDPVGIVSVQGSLIENLYVLPGEQNKGYGTCLLKFAISKCDGVPSLWILNNNEGAHALYSRHGFLETGRRNQLNETLYELEMQLK